MAFTASEVSVLVTATLLAEADADGITVTVSPVGGTVYLGGSTVATTTGLPLAAGNGMSFDLEPSGKLYAIAAATTAVRVLKHR
jgi:hypothetical protein